MDVINSELLAPDHLVHPDGFFGPPPLIPRVISLCILKNDPTPKSVTI